MAKNKLSSDSVQSGLDKTLKVVKTAGEIVLAAAPLIALVKDLKGNGK